jgi:beta-galactosidase
MAEALTKRYAHHPAVIAVGYNNEIGNGFMSYSEADRQRFIAWLNKKYGTIEELDKAWATQRWSRQVKRKCHAKLYQVEFSPADEGVHGSGSSR